MQVRNSICLLILNLPIVNLGMILAPCLGYSLQTYTMISTETSDGFSTYVSFILIISNLLRLFWWYCKRFSLVILVASIVMIFCQLVLLYYWVKIKNTVKKEGEAEATRTEKVIVY